MAVEWNRVDFEYIEPVEIYYLLNLVTLETDSAYLLLSLPLSLQRD